MADEVVVRMPRLADTLVEGTLGRWLKQVGESIAAGEPLASVETDKVTAELPAPTAGTLVELLVQEGETVAVETPIARLSTVAAAETPAELVSRPAAPAPRPTPVAARLLAEHGLRPHDIPALTGGRRLKKQDVLRHLAPPEPPGAAGPDAPRLPGTVGAPLAGRVVPLSPMRRAIAEHMTRARQTIPHGQTVIAADLTRLVQWREATKAAFETRTGVRLTLTVCFVHALARAAPEDGIDIGVAVAVDNGLVVPVIRNAGALSLEETAQALDRIAAQARARTLSAEDMRGARMTVTNVGSFGNLVASPIVPLDQVGILAPGLVERRPMPAVDGGIRVGWRCLLSLMFDRRALDDFAADRLLGAVAAELARLAPDGATRPAAAPNA